MKTSVLQKVRVSAYCINPTTKIPYSETRTSRDNSFSLSDAYAVDLFHIMKRKYYPSEGNWENHNYFLIIC